MYIFDEHSPKTCTSLSYQVGSYFNPKQLPGLAHFLEHLMFITSNKQPGTDVFGANIDRLNGTQNAYTASFFTNFIFEVYTKDQIELDLIQDIFSQMFIDPIISDENISKEVNAIESEFNMHFNESEFMWDVCNQYLTDRHPATNFDCGNKHTLFNNIEDKVFLSDIIHLFRYYQYNATNAALVITSPVEFAKMQNLIESKFGQLPNFDAATKLQEFEAKYQNTKYANWFIPFESTVVKFAGVMPIKDLFNAFELKSVTKTNTLTIIHQFTLPNKVNYVTFFKFVYQVIAEEGLGSLGNQFKEKMNINGVAFGVDKSQLDQNTFSVNYDLTEEQIQDNDFLKKISEAFQNQLEQLLKVDPVIVSQKFNYYKNNTMLRQDQTEPSRDMMKNSEIANNILEYGVENTFNENISFEEFDIKLFRFILQQLQSSNAIIFIKPANNMNNKFLNKSPQYKADQQQLCKSGQDKTRFKDSNKMSQKLLKTSIEIDCENNKYSSYLNQFKNSLQDRSIKNSSEINQLDKAQKYQQNINNFKKVDLIINQDWQRSNEYNLIPVSLKPMVPYLSDNNIEIYQLKDGQQGLPKSNLTLLANSNLFIDNLENNVKFGLYIATVIQELTTNEQYLQDLGQGIDISNTIQGLSISIYGFDKYLDKTFETIMNQLTKKDINQDIMLKKLDKLIEIKQNSVNRKSYEKAQLHWHMLLVKYKNIESTKSITQMKKLKSELVSLKSTQPLIELRDKLFNNIGKSSFLFVGTIEKNICYGIVSTQSQIVTHTNSDNILKQEQIKLNKDVTQINVPNTNIVETQTALIISQQVHKQEDMHKDVALSFILKSKLEHSIFAELRTKQQIGYIATFITKRFGDSLNMQALINGNKFPKDEMIEMYNKWFKQIIAEVKQTTQVEFDKMVLIQQQSLQSPMPSINGKSSYLMSHIETGDQNFEQLQDLIEVVKKLTLQEYIDFIDYIDNDAKRIVLAEYPDHSIKNESDVDQILKEQDENIKVMGYYEKRLKNTVLTKSLNQK